MTAPAQPPPPAEAQLIRRAREAAGLSPETAAARMEASHIGGSRWRQIEAGHRRDSEKPVIAKPTTLAHMAHAVGVTPGRLAETGRTDAAAILREVELKRLDNRNPVPGSSEVDSTSRVDDRWRMIKAMLEQAYSGLSPDEYRVLVHRIGDHMELNPEWHPDAGEDPTTPQRTAGDI